MTIAATSTGFVEHQPNRYAMKRSGVQYRTTLRKFEQDLDAFTTRHDVPTLEARNSRAFKFTCPDPQEQTVRFVPPTALFEFELSRHLASGLSVRLLGSFCSVSTGHCLLPPARTYAHRTGAATTYSNRQTPPRNWGVRVLDCAHRRRPPQVPRTIQLLGCTTPHRNTNTPTPNQLLASQSPASASRYLVLLSSLKDYLLDIFLYIHHSATSPSQSNIENQHAAHPRSRKHIILKWSV